MQNCENIALHTNSRSNHGYHVTFIGQC